MTQQHNKAHAFQASKLIRKYAVDMVELDDGRGEKWNDRSFLRWINLYNVWILNYYLQAATHQR